MDKRVIEWLAGGDTGTSSKAIAFWLTAKVKDQRWGASTPIDPSDLGRCLRLLEVMPEWKSRIGEMAEAGGEWPTYVKHWDEMAQSMADEVGIDWSKGREAPKTYELMKRVRSLARNDAGTASQYIKLGEGVEMRFGQ